MHEGALEQTTIAQANTRAPRICFVSTTFSCNAARLRYRQVMLATHAGYDVVVVAPGAPGTIWDGVTFIPQPYFKRMIRMLNGWRTVLPAWRANADLYVFYELEIQPFALLFKLFGKKVIVDIFEENPSAMVIKTWIPAALKRVVGWLTDRWERVFLHVWDGIITADPGVMCRFTAMPEERRSIVYNYPYLPSFGEVDLLPPEFDVVYVGGLSIPRGTLLLAHAIKRLRDQGRVCKVLMIGSYLNNSTKEQVEAYLTAHHLWDQFTFTGHLPYPEAMKRLRTARIGVVPFEKGIKKYESNIPSKMFDYWAAGLPVVVTDFHSASCFVRPGENGFVVKAGDTNDLADALARLLADHEHARRLGAEGQRMVHEKWNAEGPENKQMITLFQYVLSQN